MFKGRSKGSRGRGGYLGVVKKVLLKGLFADGIWQCNCDPRLPAQHFQTKNGGKNHGRWFYTCQKAQPKRCDFFLWDDEAKGREAAAVLNNSHTEPLPASSLQTPIKPSPYGLATPETTSRFRHESSNITIPYTPSKSSHTAPSNSAHRVNTQASTTQGSDSEEDFYDWPASDDDEMSKVADQACNAHSMPPPETPRKAAKTDMLSTPGKRRYDDMASESGNGTATAWPTPSTGLGGDDPFNTPATGMVGRGLFAHTTLPVPADTPTPFRYKDISLTQESELASQIMTTLQALNVSFPPDAREAVKNICDKHVLYTRGIMRGRDVSRTMVKAKDEQIAELQREVEGLRAERETNRAVIRHLRRDVATRKEANK